MRIEAGIQYQVGRERTRTPIRLLKSLIYFYVKIFLRSTGPGSQLPSKDSPRLHGVEDSRN